MFYIQSIKYYKYFKYDKKSNIKLPFPAGFIFVEIVM